MKKLFVALLTLFVATTAFAGGSVKKFDRVIINEERLLVLKGDVRDFSIDPIVKDMVVLDDMDHTNIFLVINTNGGSIEAGMRLVTTMRSIKSPVLCLIDSKAYSMGAVIAAFCTRTYIHKHANMMFHEASYGVQGPESIVPVRVEATQKYLKNFHTDIAQRVGMSYEEYMKKIANEWWLTPEEAVKAGVAYAVIDKLVYKEEDRVPPPPFFDFGFQWDVDRDKPVHIELR